MGVKGSAVASVVKAAAPCAIPPLADEI
eukprot:SAG31_NODE_9793_length_1226_cov_1.331854_1_plen_27_part_01